MSNIFNLFIILVITIFTSCKTDNIKDIKSDSRATLYSVRGKKSYNETKESFRRLLTERNITIFAEVDHGLQAENLELELLPTTLFIVGNPMLGTPLMQEDQSIGIDLPLKILITQNGHGEVWIHYKCISDLLGLYDIKKNAEELERLDGKMKKMVDAIAKL